MNYLVNDPSSYSFGPFRIDPVRRLLLRDGAPVRMPPRLFETLLYLVRNAGRVVEKDELISAVWGGRVVEETNLSQTIFSLRKVLTSQGESDNYIVTAPGRGYRFAATVQLELTPPQPPATAPVTVSTKRSARLFITAASAAGLAIVVALAVVRYLPGTAAFDPPAHSIAVLPLTNMSGDPAQDYFGDGLAEELINALSRLPEVHVAARVSAFSFKQGNATAPDIARKLNVGTVLEGSVRREGNTVRVATQLIDAKTGYQIWSRSYDRDPHDLLSMEGDIATMVASSLQVSLVVGEAARLTLGGTDNPAAFDSYLHGMLLMRSNEDQVFTKARDAFDTAIRLDPKYARAYAGRAYALSNMVMNPPQDFTPAMQADLAAQALAAADHAVALAPDLAAAHGARSVILDNGLLRPAEAFAEAAKARELEPGNAAIAGNYAQVAMDMGHVDDALAAARLAASLDPLRPDVWYMLADTLYEARRFDEAMTALQHEKQLRGSLPQYSMELLAELQLMLGQPEEADRSCESAGHDFTDICFAITRHALGKTDEATGYLARMRQENGDDSAYNYAQIYAQWGDHPAALTWLEKAYQQHDHVLVLIGADPLLDPVRDEPRFRELLRQMHLPP